MLKATRKPKVKLKMGKVVANTLVMRVIRLQKNESILASDGRNTSRGGTNQRRDQR